LQVAVRQEGIATEHYEKFLDLWKDADPGIVEVDDAKSSDLPPINLLPS
jgi:hypothetical protein